jgi:tetratricopeptide (TPR) repeat protein
MSAFLRPTIRAVGLGLACAGIAGAQEKACEVNESRPTAIGRATLAVQVAQSTQDPAAAAKQLSAAVKGLTENAERIDNQVGRNFVLGKALVLWSIQPNIEMVTTRGALGYTVNPQGTIDLVSAIDSAFKVVEAAHPECITETAQWRGQRGWVTLVNQAIEKLNADQLEEAQQIADRAIMLNPYGPYGYVIKGNVLQKQERASDAFAMYRKAIEVSGQDTTYADIKRHSLISLGNLAADSAEMAADAAAKRPYVEAARTAFEQIISDPNAGESLAGARSGMCRVIIASGDTAALRATYQPLLANPASAPYSELMNAGVCMARAEMERDATVLFKAANEKNPWHRDALSNLAIMLVNSEQFEAAIPVAQRLVSVEPNSSDNLQLLVISYAGIAKRAKEQRTAGSGKAPAAKAGAKATGAKAGAPARLTAAQIDALFKVEQAYTDSAVKANERREGLPVKVSLTEFTINDEKAVVAGTIQNNGTADKSVAMKVDFLNVSGQPVATKDVQVTVPAGRSARFDATVTPGNKEIVAFRYSRIE